jgi:transcriptional regulator with XRE-family HTH domain
MVKTRPIRVKVMAKRRLRVERVSRGYTLEHFANMIDYSTAGYGKVEMGKNGMRPQGVEKVLNVLHLEFDDLFEFVDGEIDV